MGIKEALGLGSGKKVRYAIVGVGDIAQEDMMPSVGHTGNSTVTALVTSDPKKAQEFGEKYGGENLTVASEQIKGEVLGMFSTTIVHVCRCCGSEHLRKNGHAENGDQRAKCLTCGRTFVLRPQGARYDQKFKDQVTSAYLDRMSIRGITRTFGVCYKTVLRWVGEKSGESARLRGHAAAQQRG